VWLGRARGAPLMLLFIWTFCAVFDLCSERSAAWVSVPLCLMTWGLTYLDTKINAKQDPNSDV
jgi:hypothetical protein